MNIKNNFSIFLTLLKRDFKVTVLNFTSLLIDSAIIASIFSLLYGYLLPIMGMPTVLTGPLFLGTMVITILSMSFGRTVKIKSDLEFNRFINYQSTLPISKKWLLASYISSFSIDIFISTTPVFLIGMILLRNLILFNINFFGLCIVYILALLLFSTFFLLLAFATEWEWFINNTWEKILVPVMHLGGIYFIWSRLNSFSPLLSKFILLNPLIYIIEGLRAGLFDGSEFLPLMYCVPILLFWIILMLILLWQIITKRLDLV